MPALPGMPALPCLVADPVVDRDRNRELTSPGSRQRPRPPLENSMTQVRGVGLSQSLRTQVVGLSLWWPWEVHTGCGPNTVVYRVAPRSSL